MLPEPTFTFTIPSIHDNTTLDCRLYSPPHSVLDSPEGDSVWSSRGAVIAHPYAPFGGCYDDWVVSIVAAEILKQGFVVGTFNFRGAGYSEGKTSWQGKPEVGDYSSFIGFFVHYIESLHGCEPRERLPGIHNTLPTTSASEPCSQPGSTNAGIHLIIAGYSYGSLITTLLPPTKDIIQRFAQVNKGTAEAEIRLRAVSLAAEWNKDAVSYHEALQARKTLGVSQRAMKVAIGGDESEPGSRRTSHEGRMSLDAVRRSMERSRKKVLRQHSSEVSEHTVSIESLTFVDISPPQTHYLLISPLLPPISMFATMFSDLRSRHLAHADAKFLDHPTLAIYGDKDFFVSQRRLLNWAESLKSKPGSLFHYSKVTGAGHFWREGGVDSQMRGLIRDWIQDDASSHCLDK